MTDLRTLYLQLSVAPVSDLLATAHLDQLQALAAELDHWVRLTRREIIQRYAPNLTFTGDPQ